MCPKAKADQVITHRIEFQETERDALEMVAASITAKNVASSVGSLITPFTRATIPGVILWGSTLAWLLIELEGSSPGSMFPGTVGQLGANSEGRPFSPPRDGESAKSFRERTTLSDRLKWGFWDRPTERLKEMGSNLAESL